MGDPEPLLTTAQAAARLGISRRTLSRYALLGWLTPAVVLPSGHYRWSLDEIYGQLLTTEQAATALGVAARTLSRYAKDRQLTPTLVLPSGHYRWSLADIRKQLQQLRDQAKDTD